ncbi:disease resistance protein RUN1-like isoform X1 [Daucus carota subsp. sativus]|uniref:disease resistance protein RUN1-like isoform X1 n=1 Tax=Daucus carota subsp. sativus TaxID=79200 RepID=UPI0030827F8A
MATTSNQLTATSFSSPPSWDVFLSFYGKDTRRNFIANLYFSLDQAEILTFKDDPELEKGEEISCGLLKAIHGTKMFVVVLSENYARSPWCLNELVEILNCKRNRNRIVPVFYYVDPSDLRHQKGGFGEALSYHMKRYSVDFIEKWKSALAEIGQLSGYHLKKDSDENESNIIQEIVENVLKATCREELHLEEYLVRINPVTEEIYQKLNMELNDVRAIGICGMGGIGKTTTAIAFYNKYSHEFDVSCFIENEKPHSQGDISLLPVLNQLLIKLLRRKDYIVRNAESGIKKLEQILCSKKALIVLDDLHQSIYSELLARLHSLLSAGSRIIFTTRDVNLLNQSKVDISEVDIYMVMELDEMCSLELFSYHAFRIPKPPESFRELAIRFVTYAGGVPLALKVLGSSLRGRTDVSFWKGKLEKLRKIPEKEIQEILQLSYDDLDDDTEKPMFLDIAFFFVGKDKDEAVCIFNSCDFFPDVGIPILIERCLLSIDIGNKFRMHNLIRRMGLDLGKNTRLLLGGNAGKDLQNLEGVNKIEGLILDLTMSTKRQITAEILGKLSNLRLLEIDAHYVQHDITENFKNVFHQLRCMRWHGFPWKYMSFNFCPEKLVSLEMSSRKLRILWKNPKLPDLSSLKQLKTLYIQRCHSLSINSATSGIEGGMHM